MGADGSVGQLHVVVDLQRSREQSLRRRDQSVQPRRRMVVLGERSAAPLRRQRVDACCRGTSRWRRSSLSVRRGRSTRGRTLDPFGSGDRPLARCHRPHRAAQQRANPRRTTTSSTSGVSKNLPTSGRVRVQGIVEAFNILNTEEPDQLQRHRHGSTYLQPASSTDVFYQPRQLQFGFRVTY